MKKNNSNFPFIGFIIAICAFTFLVDIFNFVTKNELEFKFSFFCYAFIFYSYFYLISIKIVVNDLFVRLFWFVGIFTMVAVWVLYLYNISSLLLLFLLIIPMLYLLYLRFLLLFFSPNYPLGKIPKIIYGNRNGVSNKAKTDTVQDKIFSLLLFFGFQIIIVIIAKVLGVKV